MNTTFVKFLLLWIICENIVLTTSMGLKGVDSEDANSRQKRSPANNFSLFGVNLGNPGATARESFSSIGNIFSSNRRNTNNYHEPRGPHGIVWGTDTNSPRDFTSRSGIQNSMPQNDLQEDRYIWAQEDKTEFVKKVVPDKKQTSNEKFNTKPPITVPQRINAPENTADNPENGSKVDSQLLEYIFQKSQMNYDGTDTTVDNNIDFVTETSEYDSTTDLGNRIAPAVVATLLG